MKFVKARKESKQIFWGEINCVGFYDEIDWEKKVGLVGVGVMIKKGRWGLGNK